MFTFDALKQGKLGVSINYGSCLAEAAAYCLYKNGHESPSGLALTGGEPLQTSLVWEQVGAELDSTWADLKEATEYGAYAVAIVVCLKMTQSARVERCAQGTGVDLWVIKSIDDNGTDDRGIFQRASRLEVSGIFYDYQNAIESRLQQKIAQSKRSDDTALPAYVAIVEFGRPEIRMHNREGR